ncbi:MAG: 3-methyl-2-oxobutanoate dehydrogenase subunit VorB [Dehalococcoidia bacterium]|nr:MAG: 3-methyl-2-oxobutanoate dehydrogenase subunit VorB [Dehalococcoidia bacterium]
MGDRILAGGNEAVGWGALSAGCRCFFGYPITPQNEIIELLARELPKRGGVFVQSQCETGAINMLFGAAATGVRAMTSTASPGWGLMQEGMSNLAGANLPCVVVVVQRIGPGVQRVEHAQMDYNSVTKSGGGGGYKNIVLAPASVQETHDLMQLAFYLADKYRNPVVVLSEGLTGHVIEPLEVKTLEFGPLPEKDWAVTGQGRHKDGKYREIGPSYHPLKDGTYLAYLNKLREKYQAMESELRYGEYETEDAELLLVAYGYCARVSAEAVDTARAEGLKAGLLRPITLWPFPYQMIRDKAAQGCRFLVVEDSLGLMVEDVKMGVEGKAEVHLADVTFRHLPSEEGMIMPGRVSEEIRRLL